MSILFNIFISSIDKDKNLKNKYKNHPNLKLFRSKSKWFVWDVSKFISDGSVTLN